MAVCSRDEYYRLFSVVFQEINFLPFSIAQNVSASETDFDRDEVQKLSLIHISAPIAAWSLIIVGAILTLGITAKKRKKEEQ